MRTTFFGQGSRKPENGDTNWRSLADEVRPLTVKKIEALGFHEACGVIALAHYTSGLTEEERSAVITALSRKRDKLLKIVDDLLAESEEWRAALAEMSTLINRASN